jgi:hypothetical protein
MTFSPAFSRVFQPPFFGAIGAAELVYLLRDEFTTSSVYITDAFDGTNGAPINGKATETGSKTWTAGAGWKIQSNYARNSPTLGSDLLTNGDAEGTYISGVAPSWSYVRGTASESADAHTGIAAQQITNPAGNTGLVSSSTFAQTNGAWYLADVWAKTQAGSGGLASFAYPEKVLGSGTAAAAGAGWTETFIGGRSTEDFSGNSLSLFAVSDAVANTNGVKFDSLTVKEVTLSSAIASIDSGISNRVRVNARVLNSSTARTPVGIVACLDSTSNPQNFLIAYINGTGNRLWLEKCVGGVYTTLISAATISYGSNRDLSIEKDGETVRVYYYGAKIGTDQTVSDAGIINNTRHGIFSIDGVSSLNDFSVTDIAITRTCEPTGTFDIHQQTWLGLSISSGALVIPAGQGIILHSSSISSSIFATAFRLKWTGSLTSAGYRIWLTNSAANKYSRASYNSGSSPSFYAEYTGSVGFFGYVPVVTNTNYDLVVVCDTAQKMTFWYVKISGVWKMFSAYGDDTALNYVRFDLAGGNGGAIDFVRSAVLDAPLNTSLGDASFYIESPSAGSSGTSTADHSGGFLGTVRVSYRAQGNNLELSHYATGVGYSSASFNKTATGIKLLTRSSTISELAVRWTDDNNCWIFRFDHVAGTIKIVERNAGVETERASISRSSNVSNITKMYAYADVASASASAQLDRLFV